MLRYASQHPDKGSDAISNALELPRGRVRGWTDGGKPDAARGIEYIADIAAGDAREAIKHLEKATKRVVRDDRPQITLEDVNAIHCTIRTDLRQDHIDTLGTHKRLLYDIVADAGRIGVTDLHATYEERIGNPKPNRTRRRYLSTLVDKYGLLETTGTGRGKNYSIPDF